MWQEIIERLTPTFVEAVVMAGSAAIAAAGIWLARKIAQLAEAKRITEEQAQKLIVIKGAIEAGVEDAWMRIGRAAKAAAEDGKLSAEDVKAIRAMMLETAQRVAHEKGVALLEEWNVAEVLAFAKKVVQSRKAAKAAPAVLLPAAESGG